MNIEQHINDPRFGTLVNHIRDKGMIEAFKLGKDWFGDDRETRRAVYAEATEEAQVRNMTGNHLTITPEGVERLKEVNAFLDSLPDTPEGRKSRRSFRKNYAYLNEYGGTDEAGNRRFRVFLGRDSAEHSFGVWWSRRQPDGSYEPCMSGGLIYHRHDGTWGVHT